MATQIPAPKNHDERIADGGSRSCPPGTPDWITAELIDRTVRVWQPHYRELLTTDDAVERLWNVRRLADILVGVGPPRQ